MYGRLIQVGSPGTCVCDIIRFIIPGVVAAAAAAAGQLPTAWTLMTSLNWSDTHFQLVETVVEQFRSTVPSARTHLEDTEYTHTCLIAIYQVKISSPPSIVFLHRFWIWGTGPIYEKKFRKNLGKLRLKCDLGNRKQNLGQTYAKLKINLIRKMQFLKNNLTFLHIIVCI